MKKITLALCACAFALTGLLASCSNGSDYINCNTTKSEYKYAVSGTITTTTSYEELRNSTTFALDADGKSYKNSSTTTDKINGGWITVKWEEDENRTSNYTQYNISGNATKVSSEGSSEFSFDTYASSSKGSSNGGSKWLSFNIADVDGTYYINLDNEMVKLDDLAISEDEDAFEGDFGDEFSLNIKITKNNLTDITWTKDNETNKKANKSNTTVTEYKLTFVPVEDFDPEDFEDAE